MKLLFLGTSAGAPSRTRNVSAIVLQDIHPGQCWLFDCGEGTQHRFMDAPVRLSQVEKIFITHLHGDHVFGLPGLLASRSSAQMAETAVDIYGPPPISAFVQTVLSLTHTGIKYPLAVHALAPGVVLDNSHCAVMCLELNHRISSLGYAIVEKDLPGEFNVQQAIELGIRPGPVFGDLKAGGQATLADGRTIDGHDLVGPAKRGRKVVVLGDTGESAAALELARDADVLVHEATFMNEQSARAAEVGHSTAAGAARVALAAGVGTLILTHISPRYEKGGTASVEQLLDEAREIFPSTVIASDYMTFEVSRPPA